MKRKTKKIITGIVGGIVAACAVAGLVFFLMTKKSDVELAMEEIGAESIEEFEHRGKSSNAATFYMITPEHAADVEQVVAGEGWHELPLAEKQVWNSIGTVLDTMESQGAVADGRLVLRDLQEIESGYWFFLDKNHPETKAEPDYKKTYYATEFHLVMAVYDATENIIYYFEMKI
ncbi:MAG: hypothetical protein IJY09_00165 [Lachnospiraceae bacterium]|nr:hypothetical protein [Lachnospiraceae bacterium]